MPTIKFIIQSTSDLAGIYVRLKEGRNIDAKAKTKFAINPQEWSEAKGRPKNLQSETHKRLNVQLDNLYKSLLDHYNNRSENDTIDTQWLKDFLNPQESPKEIPTKLTEYIEYYILHKKNMVGSSTYKRNKVYKRLIEKFEQASERVYYIKDVNADFKIRFENFCIESKYALNTIARTVKFIKTICYHARSNAIETHFQLNNLKVKLVKVEKVYLTSDELEQIEKKDFDFDYLENAKDWLIISCETGQRVSDFMRFRKENIRYEGKVPIIEFTQVKTEKRMAIPLSKKVMAILKKRDGDFPRQISDQRYNEYIKDVARIAGIDKMVKGSKLDIESKRKESGLFPKYELITSHIGRRSFATNNFGRIPTSLLRGVTGHSTEKMFLEYIGKTETDNAIQIAKYF
ncbi:MAG TPA: tyrosine-type recombinase/integrase [Bacteroidia bacterium]|nr:tyrosine-type recombinase/integrase [Bacteroidia bacterium]HRH08168.1 tyrosine-type recombinase/integrase [Bacteroidia bacterium]